MSEKSSTNFPLYTRITDALQELEASLATLSKMLCSDSQLQIVSLMLLPYRRAAQEEALSMLEPEPVSIEEQTPEMLSSLVSTIRYQEDQHPKSTLRAPGLVGVSDATLAQIQRVNELKAEFKAMVKEIPTRQRRVLSRMFPGLSRLQAYRELVILKYHPKHVHFFWAANKTTGSRITVDQLRKELEVERDATPATDVTLRQAIAYDLELLEALPGNEWLSKRRSIRVHPQCNVWAEDSPLDQEDAYLPIFYAVDASKPEPGVTPLVSFDAQESQGKRSMRSDRKVERSPYLERIHVYRYQEQHRKFA